MAPEELKTKKRKGATDSAPKPKKQKSDNLSAATKKSSKASKSAVDPVEDSIDNDVAAPPFVKEKKSKKGTATAKLNGASDEVDVNAKNPEIKEKSKKKGKKDNAIDAADALALEVPKDKGKKSKKAKASDAVEATEATAVVEETLATATSKKSKKAKSSKKQKDEEQAEVTEIIVEEDIENEDVDDDQTAALLAGFESDRDESDLEKEDESFDEDIEPKISKSQRTKLQKIEKGSKKEEPGVLFVGRIPHGFFEPQMKRYFQQFGTITRLRLSRNKKTGASKHYAFVEFASAEVAEIVAKTMNNYLMFGHILQCRVVAPEHVHPDLFKGAGERFKVDPRNKKAGLEMERGVQREVWEKRVEKEQKRRAKKSEKLRDEFDYDFTSTGVKSVDEVPRKVSALQDDAEQQLLSEAPANEITAIEKTSESKPGQLTVTETVTVKKSKVQAEPKVIEAIEEIESVQPKKGKKDKKRKSDAVIEAAEIEEIEEKVNGDEVVTKSKKARKAAKAEGVEGEVVQEKKETKRKAEQDGVKPKKTKKAKA